VDPTTAFDFERAGLLGALAFILVAVVRAALTRAWVPGAFYQDMKTERDSAQADARRATALAEDLTDLLQNQAKTHDKLVSEMREK
jgi:hypothetical protein